MLEDSLKTPDFARFVETAMRLAVHMALNDPPI
jgi:pantoate kinase